MCHVIPEPKLPCAKLYARMKQKMNRPGACCTHEGEGGGHT